MSCRRVEFKVAPRPIWWGKRVDPLAPQWPLRASAPMRSGIGLWKPPRALAWRSSDVLSQSLGVSPNGNLPRGLKSAPPIGMVERRLSDRISSRFATIICDIFSSRVNFSSRDSGAEKRRPNFRFLLVFERVGLILTFVNRAIA